MEFQWDIRKDRSNLQKHGVSFRDAQLAFFDPMRVIAADVRHTTVEEARYFCFGKVGDRVATVRFTIRGEQIRIFGAGLLARRQEAI